MIQPRMLTMSEFTLSCKMQVMDSSEKSMGFLFSKWKGPYILLIIKGKSGYGTTLIVNSTPIYRSKLDFLMGQ